MTTAAANNNSLFAATVSRVGENDNLPFAPTSPSADELSPLGGSSPTQDESSRENNNSHYQRNSLGDEKILCYKKILIVESENNSENNSKKIPQKNYLEKIY